MKLTNKWGFVTLAIIGVALVACTVLFSADSVYAACTFDSNGGKVCDGSESKNWVTVACSDSWGAHNTLCPESTRSGSGGGGASWHIYKIGASGPSCLNNDRQKDCSLIQQAQTNCASAGWYVVYGWDGKNNSRHNGPIQWGTGNISYNSYGAVGWDVIESGFKDGTLGNNIKLTQEAHAMLFGYMLASLGASMSETTGYYCASRDPFVDPEPDDVDVEDPNAGLTGDQLCLAWAPGGYTNRGQYGGVSSVDIRIKNANARFNNVGFGTWNNYTIYAMPTDVINWHTCYFPGVQSTASTNVSSLNGGKKGYEELDCSGTSCKEYSVSYQELHVKHGAWTNRYSVWGAGGNGGGSYGTGDQTVRFSDNSYTTTLADAGKEFTESTETGLPSAAGISSSNPTCSIYKSPCCPQNSYCSKRDSYGDCIEHKCDETNDCYTCTSSYSSTLYSASTNENKATDAVSVKVPYNYENYTGVSIGSGDVYAGETVRLATVWTQVGTRYNNVTQANYATKVPGAQVKVFAYVSSGISGGYTVGSSDGCNVAAGGSKQCLEVSSKSATLNSGGSLTGANETHSDLQKIYNVFDASAGDYMCFISAVYPASVGTDTDMAEGGNGLWRYSAPSCAVIAKKPTFQVWGGSLYSVGGINSPVGAKRNIYNDYFNSRTDLSKNGGFKITGGNSIYFTPWVEQSLILKDGITGVVSSGAGTGYNSTNPARAGTMVGLCDSSRSALSFANYSNISGVACNGTATVGKSGINNIVSNREELIEYWVGADISTYNSQGGFGLDLSVPDWVGQPLGSASGKKIRYVGATDWLTVYGAVPYGTTYLIKSDSTVTITGNITYNGAYTASKEIPKVVIYAANVNIACNVDEVDAIIITKSGGGVNTCSSASEYEDDPARSRRLKIFGMVIADWVNLGRTYGAAAWDSSRYSTPTDGLAAEVFDFDTSIFMWSESMSGSGESDTLQTVYQHEVAPRY